MVLLGSMRGFLPKLLALVRVSRSSWLMRTQLIDTTILSLIGVRTNYATLSSAVGEDRIIKVVKPPVKPIRARDGLLEARIGLLR